MLSHPLTLKQIGVTSALHHELKSLGLSDTAIHNHFFDLLDRYRKGDWGDTDAHDKRINDVAVETGDRIVAQYEVSGTEVWIISDPAWDRSIPYVRQTTTILRPSDY